MTLFGMPRQWGARDSARVATVKVTGHPEKLLLLPDGRALCALEGQGVFNISPSGALNRLIETNGESRTVALEVSADGALIAASCRLESKHLTTIYTCVGDAFTAVHQIGHTNAVLACRIYQNNQQYSVVFIDTEGKVESFDVGTYERKSLGALSLADPDGMLSNISRKVTSAAIARDRRRIAGLTSDFKVATLDVDTGEKREIDGRELFTPGFPGIVSFSFPSVTLAIADSGMEVAVGTQSGRIAVVSWGKSQAIHESTFSSVRSLCFLPTSKGQGTQEQILLIAAFKGARCVAISGTGEQEIIAIEGVGDFECIAVSDDGRRAAVSERQGLIHFLEFQWSE